MKRPAAQLTIGDIQYADNGKPRTVTSVVTTDNNVTVLFADGTTATFTPDLPVRIRRTHTSTRPTHSLPGRAGVPGQRSVDRRVRGGDGE
jgi:hypothetical protein